MPSVESSGTITTTAGEQTIVSSIANRSFVLWIDMSLLQAADTIVIKAKRKVLSGGTIRIVAQQTFAGVQDPPNQSLVPIACPYGADFTIQRTAGTDRNIPWSLESL